MHNENTQLEHLSFAKSFVAALDFFLSLVIISNILLVIIIILHCCLHKAADHNLFSLFSCEFLLNNRHTHRQFAIDCYYANRQKKTEHKYIRYLYLCVQMGNLVEKLVHESLSKHFRFINTLLRRWTWATSHCAMCFFFLWTFVLRLPLRIQKRENSNSILWIS